MKSYSSRNSKLDYLNITFNRRALFEYLIDREIEAGLSLEGWEVKSVRASKVNISNSYVQIKSGEAYLFNAIFQPLITNNLHQTYNTTRNRKLLLNKKELDLLYGCISRKHYTIIVLSLFWKKSWIKTKIGIARGKKNIDKRQSIKAREWKINRERIINNKVTKIQ